MTIYEAMWCRRLGFLSVVAAYCLLTALPAAGSQKSSEVAIRSAYAKLQKALLNGDGAALSAMLAPDFQQRNADDLVESRDAYVREQTEATPGLAISSLVIVIARLAVHGNIAQGDATYSQSGTYFVNKTPKPFKAVSHVTDEWAVIAGTWKLRSTAVHDVVSYVDGKIVEDEREQVPASNKAIAELQSRAVAVPTLALDADPDQLSGIGKAIGSARIVGMGEGSHGTSEFFAFKNRLFKYLVEKKGFTVLAMEAVWGNGLNVDRYIKTGRGTAQQAVASLGFWTWNTPEVVDLVQWMHDYNMAPGKHPILSFAGVDMQEPMGAIGYLVQYLRKYNPAEIDAAYPALRCTADSVADFRVKPTDDCIRRVAAMGDELRSTKGVPDVAIAQQAVTNVLQFLSWRSDSGNAMTQIRDQDMAKNLEWVAAQYSGAKVALWAHNGHVGAFTDLGYRSMGSYLREAFGSNYYAIGQTFGSGAVRSGVSGKGLQSVTVPPIPGDTLAALFAPLKAAAFLDFRGLPAGSALRDFFATQRDIQGIGSTIDPARPNGQRKPAVLPNSFDGLVYIPTSTAAVSEIPSSHMQREIHENGTIWAVASAGLDGITASTTQTGATYTNRDGLDATPNYLLRRYDAAPYVGQAIRATYEIRTTDLLGFALPMLEAKAGEDLIAASGGNSVDTTKSGWTQIALVLKVPPNATSIYVGFWSEGFGSVEIRNLRVETMH